MVTNLDEHVGAVLTTLDELGLAEKTLVVFSSDNGATHQHPGDPQLGVGGADTRFFNSTGGLRDYKGSVYEGGIRVPLIVRWPGMTPGGAVCIEPVTLTDLFHTLHPPASGGRLAERDGLDIGVSVAGPAIVEQFDATTVVPPTWSARVDRNRNLILERRGA